jgi:hypothetical protein
MKAIKISAMVAMAILLMTAGCKKDTTSGPDNYANLSAFYAANGVALQHYTVDAAAGGSFTSPQGTVVTIAPNSFLTKTGGAVTGSVDVDFKDIYKKSDMLMSFVPTVAFYGAPIKSGGEFFIKASQGGNALILTGLKPILVAQPLNGKPIDSAMVPMVRVQDTVGQGQTGLVWAINGSDTVRNSPSGYVFSLYTFANPPDSGSWCNSDNPSYFSAYTQGTLTLTETDTAQYGTTVFLVFSGLNSMVHVYNGTGSTFPYYYAPIGLQCTVVAVGTKGGKLYASFTPITITNNLNVNFSLSPTTTSAFKSSLQQLDN